MRDELKALKEARQGVEASMARIIELQEQVVEATIKMTRELARVKAIVGNLDERKGPEAGA